MLIQLSIRNIVLIESCEINLKSGLCVLSGETGAGKSILLDALGLALGARAEAGLIRQGETQGSVSAEFDITANEGAQSILKELDLEASDTLIIRRNVSSDGKTRCLINDQPVTVSGLKRIGETLVEIHGQHDQRSLQDTSLHRDLLDAYGAQIAARKEVAAAYEQWKIQSKAAEALRAEIAQAEREREYLTHMHKELDQLSPAPGEEETLTLQRTTMMQSEKLFEVLNEAIAKLNQGEGVVSGLRSAERLLARSTLSASGLFTPIIEALDKAAIEAGEAQEMLERTGQEAQYNPEKLEQIEERLFALKAAGRKYNLPVEELPILRDQVAEKIKLIQTQNDRIGKLEEAEAQAKSAFAAAAKKLSAGRVKASAKLEKAIEAELKPLKMEGTRFRVRIEPLPEEAWAAHGADAIAFECATNVTKGASAVNYAPLNKIASGGELSRFMLAMKVALLSVRQASTLIFDEIDSGTGGAVADAIGQRLAKLGQAAQILVVTHLPQVAARGSQHLLVSKRQKAKKIITEVVELSHEERGEELARMLAGATITPEARKAAQKLLEEAA